MKDLTLGLHAVGAIFQAGGSREGASSLVTHAPNSDVVKAIMDSPNFYNWILKAFQTKVSDINNLIGTQVGDVPDQKTIESLEEGGVGKLTLWASATQGVNSFPPDLYAVVGDAQATKVTLSYKARKINDPTTAIVITDLQLIDGEIKDLFDWDYDVTIKGTSLSGLYIFGPMAQGGAKIQAAHGTIGGIAGRGGLVYENIYQLGNGRRYPGFVLFP